MSVTYDGCCRRVLDLCDSARTEIADEEVSRAVDLVRAQLSEPLRVAVAGRVKSGKSTLVNALLAHKVAPTAYGECTRAVTWFRFGYPPQANLLFKHGGTRRLPLERGQRLPNSLGADTSDLDRVEVELSSEALREMTVIDTPGLESANDEYSAATRRTLALGSGIRRPNEEDGADMSRRTEEAAGKADALVFVLTGAARQDEIEVLESFRGHLGGLRASAVNTIVVLNKADLLGEEGDDPLEAAYRLAEKYAERLGPLAAAVIPTVGVVAETLDAGLLTESHAGLLRQITGLPVAERTRLLDNVDWFVSTQVQIPRSERQELLDLLGLYGVRRCIEQIEKGRDDMGSLRQTLSQLTGLEHLRSFLDDLFARRADVLKAANALADLEGLAATAERQDADWLSRAVERVRLDPAMRALATTWAFAQVVAHKTDLPGPLEADLRQVALGGDPAQMLGLPAESDVETVRAASIRGSDRWRRFANDGGAPEQQRIADVMCQQYAALWQLAGSAGSSG